MVGLPGATAGRRIRDQRPQPHPLSLRQIARKPPAIALIRRSPAPPVYIYITVPVRPELVNHTTNPACNRLLGQALMLSVSTTNRLATSTRVAPSLRSTSPVCGLWLENARELEFIRNQLQRYPQRRDLYVPCHNNDLAMAYLQRRACAIARPIAYRYKWKAYA